MRDIVRTRVPESQDPFFVVSGSVYVSLLWGFGGDVEVSWRELRKLLANSRGTIIVGRRLTLRELRMLMRARSDVDVEAHASIIVNERVRWRGRR